jgi:hypothetical protein
MIGQYLPNNNETATVAFRQKFCQLNSPIDDLGDMRAAGRAQLQRKASHIMAQFRSRKFCKRTVDSPSHRIFGRMHEALNIDKK